MNNLLTYIIELNIVLSFMYLLYLLLFRKDGNFAARRTILLVILGCATAMPFFHIPVPGSGARAFFPVIKLGEVVVNATGGGPATNSAMRLVDIIFMGYMLISLVFLARIAIVVIHIFIQRYTSQKIIIDGTIIRKNRKLHASSFFGIIFLDPDQLDEDSCRQILSHELCHARLIHSADRLLAEILLSVSWANPVAWMFRKSVIGNHEFQADNRVINKGTDQVSYQLTLLNQYIGSANLSISNQFSSQIKNRIIMLNKANKKGAAWKALLLVPAAVFLFLAVSCGNEEDADVLKDQPKDMEEELFYVVEEMPRWSDGSELAPNMRMHIAENLDYPDEAINNGVEGKVFVHFIVNKEGRVIIPDPEMLPPALENDMEKEVVVVAYRTINEGDEMPDEKYIQLLKDEAVRVVSELPRMQPGKQRGKNVNVVFTMPITFKLQ